MAELSPSTSGSGSERVVIVDLGVEGPATAPRHRCDPPGSVPSFTECFWVASVFPRLSPVLDMLVNCTFLSPDPRPASESLLRLQWRPDKSTGMNHMGTLA